MVSHEQPSAIATSGAGLGARRGTTTSSLVERRRARGMAELWVETGAAAGGDDGNGRWDEETNEDGHRSPTITSPPPLRIE